MRRGSLLLALAVAALLASEVLAWRRQPEFKDYYGILQVSRGASEDEIKKSFKKLARKYHPDVQKGMQSEAEREAARQKFIAISDAYEVLIDPKKRAALENSNGQQGPVSAGDDRNFLRHNLFQNDYDGDQLQKEEIEKIILGKEPQNTLVFFWSGEMPDCIDPGLDYKKMATRLKGTSMRVAAFNCDVAYQSCRHKLGIATVPAMAFFPAKSPKIEFYRGKYEANNMAEFAAKHLRAHRIHNRNSSVDAILGVTPNVLLNAQLRKPHGWMTPYFSEVLGKRSIGYTVTSEFVAFVFSPCYDCDTELSFALEGLSPVIPTLVTRRVACSSYSSRERCEAVVGQIKDKAWVVAHIQRTCYFATKKPFAFSDEHCAKNTVELYKGRYKSSEFASFILSKYKTHTIPLKSLKKVKASNESFAVLFVDSVTDSMYTSGWKHEWEVLSRAINSYRPIKGSKGWRVRAAIVDCSAPSNDPGLCDDVRAQPKPVAALYSFGTKSKATTPHFYTKMGSAFAMINYIQRDMEPLHLHVITNKKQWDEKVIATVAKGRRWIVLFNAGQWCPPCNAIRPQWREVARLVQNHPTAAAKLSVAVVECDAHAELCRQQNIDNFPTVFFHTKDRARVPFNGNRDATSIVAWAVEALDSRLLRLGFQEISFHVQKGDTLLLSFTAGEWCPPCTQLKPVYKDVANKLPNTMVVEVNCDADGYLCNNFGIQGYPTLVLFHKHLRTEFQGHQKTVDTIVPWVKENTR